MRKILFLVVTLLLLKTSQVLAIDHSTDKLLSCLALAPGAATQDKVTAVLGTPSRVEEGKKRTLWYYTHGNTNLVVSWSKKSDMLVRFFFKCEKMEEAVFDNTVSSKLKSGATDIIAAVKLLGTPKDMTIKEGTQEVHYAYSNSVLRLFFRDRILVDYTLLSQN